MPNKYSKSVRSQTNEVIELLLNKKKPKTTISHHNSIHTHLPNSEEISRQVVAAIQPMFARLTNEVQSLRKELQELKNEKVKIKRVVMPAEPFKNIDAFLDFEKGLQESTEKLSCFENELTMVAKTPNFIKNCWRKILTDELGMLMCWKGTETKKSVINLSTTKAIKNAALSVGNTEEQLIKETRTFFQFAKNRIELRKNYKNKKNKINCI